MPLQETSGAASFDAFGGAAAAPVYIEDVYSTYLYTGTGATQTITNGIDLSGKGGLVWAKRRNDVTNHALLDSTRAVDKPLASNLSNGNITWTNSFTAFNANGFSVGSDPNGVTNASGGTYASWTFREQPKFFDVVAYTGTGANRTVSHNLGSVPGCIIVKRTDTTGDWQVYHRSLANTQYLVLNGTSAAATSATRWNSTTPTSTEFTVGTAAEVNASGGTYVAYLFAHNAGGFGLTGTDNVITCGTYLGSNHRSQEVVSLGYEPQWVMIKNVSSSANRWVMVDNMRGMANGGVNAWLAANSTAVETSTTSDRVVAASTGFFFSSSQSDINEAGSTFIYIAIRRGPMKTPTSGTSVFYPYVTSSVSNAGSSTSPMYDSQLVTDMAWQRAKGGGDGWYLGTRLTATAYLKSETTAAESTSAAIVWDSNKGAWSLTDSSYGLYCFRRAPGFFDVVCYAGTGSNTTVTHNLAAVPELMIIKERNNAGNYWQVYSAALGNGSRVYLNTNDASEAASAWNNTTPTSTVFSLGTSVGVNGSGRTYVAYLFATVAGVSKVGSYTGTGTTQVINCGFTAGSRFVMIKRTDSTGDWYVWDSARGIVSGNDPYLLLNSAAAEVTNTDYVDTANSGFEISSTAPAAINANGGTFIFLAIA